MFNQQSAIKNQQCFLLAFVERKLFTQLVHNYFTDEKGPASRGTGVGVRLNDCLRLRKGDARRLASVFYSVMVLTRFAV